VAGTLECPDSKISRIEVAFVDGHVAVRDSKHPQGPVLIFTRVEWDAFVAGVHAGELSHP
jgi:Domain of unknown function (DUF397)